MAYGSVLGRNTKPQFVPTFAISGPLPGDTVTVSYGGTTVEAVEDNGVWYAKAWAYGSYTVNLISTLGNKSTTVNVDEVKLYEVMLTIVNTTLNNNSWDVIRKIADVGQASDYWNVGDRKAVVLNGTIGALTLSNYTTYCFILGFNHNAELEGNNTIHFQFGKTALSGGYDVAFVDAEYGNLVSKVVNFSMSSQESNSGGWRDSQMRINICGTNLSNYSGKIIGAIPAELRATLKPIIKYTNNIGNSTLENAVTATTDYFFLLSEYESYATTTHANVYESNKQKQYTYYSAGNSKVKYKYNSTATKITWWLRSPYTNPYRFMMVYVDQEASYRTAESSEGFAPAFAV